MTVNLSANWCLPVQEILAASKKIHFISIDGLSGLEEAIKNCFPMAVVKRCIVHPVRNSVKYIPTRHCKAFCKGLKAMYSAVSLDAARAVLDALKTKWAAYPSALNVWISNFAHVEQLHDYPAEIRKMIYTTNMIEHVNSGLRKVTNRKAAFPSDLSAMKISFRRIMDITAKWSMSIPDWAVAP
ncbi:MAG: transposase [Clostridia bacterium]